jgi:CBS domain-containing protein
MPQTIQDVMTKTTRTVESSATIQQAAEIMAQDDIGDVIVTDGGRVSGIVTDRDITIRCTAIGAVPSEALVRDAYTPDPVSVAPTDSVGDAVGLMRAKAIRRLPVVEGDRPVGIVSIGDLAIERDSRSVLADISVAEGDK